MKIDKLFVVFIIVLLFVVQGVIASGLDDQLITVEGKIFLDSAEPVEGFVTAVYTGSHILLKNYRVDEDGNYSFETRKGFQSLLANASGYMSEEISIDPSKLTNSRIKQDFYLNSAFKLSGTVFNDKGLPIPNAEVRIEYLDSLPRTLTFEEEKGDGVISDEQGRYTLPFVAADKPFVLYSFSENSIPGISEEIVINSKDTFDVNVMIGPERGAVKGELVDTHDTPIIGAHILLRASADGEIYTKEEMSSEGLRDKIYQRTTSNDSGEFYFPCVPFGKVSLIVNTLDGKKNYEEISHFSEKNSATEVTIIQK